MTEQGEVPGAHRRQVGRHRRHPMCDAGEVPRCACALGHVNVEGEVPSQHKMQLVTSEVEARECGLCHQGDTDMRSCQKHSCVHWYSDGGRRPLE